MTTADHIPQGRWPIVWIHHQPTEISFGWALRKLQDGLTPQDCDAIALAADEMNLTTHEWLMCLWIAKHLADRGLDLRAMVEGGAE